MATCFTFGPRSGTLQIFGRRHLNVQLEVESSIRLSSESTHFKYLSKGENPIETTSTWEKSSLLIVDVTVANRCQVEQHYWVWNLGNRRKWTNLKIIITVIGHFLLKGSADVTFLWSSEVAYTVPHLRCVVARHGAMLATPIEYWAQIRRILY